MLWSAGSFYSKECLEEGVFSGYRPRLLLASTYAASVIASTVDSRAGRSTPAHLRSWCIFLPVRAHYTSKPGVSYALTSQFE